MMGKTASRLSISLLLCLVLAGCGGARIYGSDYRSSYSQSDLGYGAGIVTAGARFGMPREAFTALVASTMPQPLGRSVRYEPLAANGGAGTRVVWWFGEGERGRGDELCNLATEDGAASAPTTVMAAFCRGPSALSWTTGRLPAPATGPNDPALRSLIAGMTTELFPMRNPREPLDRSGPFFRP